ncbi:MAG: sigma-E factor negative regulatory protein, partial [Gammaproteobacteria bacterium]
MGKIIEEQLSVWLDDELEERESDMLVRRLTSNPELRQTATRYFLIGDALRGELTTERALEVSVRVSRSLDGESAPVTAAPATTLSGWRRPLAGAAVAATVAVVAIV